MVGFFHTSGMLIDSIIMMALWIYVPLASSRLTNRHTVTVIHRFSTPVFVTLTAPYFQFPQVPASASTPYRSLFIYGASAVSVHVIQQLWGTPLRMWQSAYSLAEIRILNLSIRAIFPFKVIDRPREGRGVGWEGFSFL